MGQFLGMGKTDADIGVVHAEAKAADAIDTIMGLPPRQLIRAAADTILQLQAAIAECAAREAARCIPEAADTLDDLSRLAVRAARELRDLGGAVWGPLRPN
jgi:acyl-CoA reductase-like NAD-dependent aldehyde dehydrogenase